MSKQKLNRIEKEKWSAIIKSCIRNNRKAQEKLYRHFFPIMERMVLKYTQDEDQLIDIINNGLLKVFQNLGKYSFEGSFEGWVRRIVFRSLSDYFRSNKKNMAFLIYEESFKSEPRELPSHELYYQDLISLVDKLPETQMKVFHLFAIEGFTHNEIGARLGINQSTCRWHLAQARKNLQEEYFKNYTKNYNETA